MKLTEALKSWLREHKGLSDASDDDYRKAAADALLDGSLKHEDYVEMAKDPDSDKASGFIAEMKQQMAELQKQIADALTKKVEPEVVKEQPKFSEKAPKMDTVPAAAGGDSVRSTFDRMFATAEDVSGTGEPMIRVIGAHEQYDDTKRVAICPSNGKHGSRHPFAGMPAMEQRTPLHEASELDQAVNGAYIKWRIHCDLGGRNIPAKLRLTDHDRDLMQFAMNERKWTGVINGEGTEDDGAIAINNRKLSAFEQKALITDVTSGGTSLVPNMFDENVILPAILYGEFAPRVNMIPITRGTTVDSATIGALTVAAGTEGSAYTLQTTTSFISAFQVPIFVVTGGIEVGLDHISDSPVDIAGVITQQYGERLMEWLDKVICVGDGTTQPQGIYTAAPTTVTPAGGAGAAAQVGDYESLLFTVSKAYRAGTPADRICYGASEKTYWRARAIAVGASDARRVFGMTHEDYMLLGHPFLINANFTEAQAIFANLARYRMYRRLGMTFKTTTEGSTLTRSNLMLITMRARFGGEIETISAAARIIAGQA